MLAKGMEVGQHEEDAEFLIQELESPISLVLRLGFALLCSFRCQNGLAGHRFGWGLLPAGCEGRVSLLLWFMFWGVAVGEGSPGNV